MADISIADAYQQVLGRTPSADEIAYWQSQFGTAVDPVELSNFSVAAQPERAAAAPTNTAVRDMYRQVLGREPDASGLQYFADRFGTSVDPTELGIFQSMASQEIAANAARNAAQQLAAQQAAAAANTTTTTTAAGTGAATTAATTGMSVADAYRQVLGREPDAAGLKYFSDRFGATVDPTELSTFSVMAQPELAQRPTTNSAIRQMYLSVLGREPDASGLKYFSDRFGNEVDANELGIFRGMSSQELAANAARNTKATTTATTGAITRPTTPAQVTSSQLAPAQVTNTAITGTPYLNIYTPATIQQNAPTLAQINAASQSTNPYQSLMALTPQRTISPAYAAQAGLTTANTNLGGFNPATATTTTTGTGLLGGGATGATVEQPGSANTSTGTGMQGINNQAALSAALSNLGLTGLGQALATSVGNQLSSLTQADILGGGTSSGGGSTGGIGGAGDGPAGIGGDFGLYAKGGMVNMKPQKYNPPGPDDGLAGLDNGEYVIKKSAVKKYGSNIFEQINAGKIPAKRLKSLLE